MKRLSAVIVVGLTVVGVSVAESTAAASSGPPAGYSVIGSARGAYPSPAGPGYSVLDILAHSGLAGQNPGGSVSVQGDIGIPMGAFTAGGAVTCVRVSGNKVAIKYRFAYATGSAAPFAGGGVEVFVQDNGRSHDGRSVDATAFEPPQPVGVFDATASQCDDPNVAAYSQVQSGDYTLARHARGRARHHGRRSTRG